MLPRPIAKLIASLLGYFWLPCPRCGQMFAGFEGKGDMPKGDGSGKGLMTCCPPYAWNPAVSHKETDA